MNTKEMVCLAARLADEKKAENIRVIDLNGQSALCDFVLIVTATSKPHLDSIEEEISKKLKEHGIYKLNRDGRESPFWRVSDYGGFLAHIMVAQARDFYGLDELFSFGKDVDFTKPVKKVTAKKTATRKTTVAKKGTTQKTVKKTTAKKPTAKKTTGKKPAAKKQSSKKTTKKK